MDFIIRPYKPGEENYVSYAHKRIYSEEYRWGEPFISYATAIPQEFASKVKSEREEMWIAEADGKPVVCIMLCETENPDRGQLRLFLVEKDYRKYGIGKALTAALLEKAKVADYKELVLYSASILTGAIKHYESLGFKLTGEIENNDWSLDGDVIKEIEMIKKM